MDIEYLLGPLSRGAIEWSSVPHFLSPDAKPAPQIDDRSYYTVDSPISFLSSAALPSFF